MAKIRGDGLKRPWDEIGEEEEVNYNRFFFLVKLKSWIICTSHNLPFHHWEENIYYSLMVVFPSKSCKKEKKREKSFENFKPRWGSWHVQVCGSVNMFLCQVECVGSVDSGLRCMEWSPDQELVVFMTGWKILFMLMTFKELILLVCCFDIAHKN